MSAATSSATTFCEGATQVLVRGTRAGVAFAAQDWVADEVPVALEFNGVSHAVMLATPLDLEDFALGFALTEGIVGSADELYATDEQASPLGITLQLRIATGAFEKLKDRRRTLTGRTGCGLCGIDSLQHVVRPLPALASGAHIQQSAIPDALKHMASLQTLQQATGAVHAAAWCTAQGEVQWLREDVGRHNALDKLVGALARHAVPAHSGFICVTSRASFEMVQKTAAAGVSLLAAVSAPTSLAIHTAQRLGVCLVGFARGQDLVVYSHHEHMSLANSGQHAEETPHAH
jgi:FdhD protein